MAFPWLAASNIGSTLLGGIIGSKGQSSANRANLQIAREQMKFQERMSSTAYQRSAKDLEAAGLNRILALGSPSSSPGGASAVMQNPKAALGEAVGKTTAKGLEAKITRQSLDNMRAVEQRDNYASKQMQGQWEKAQAEIALLKQNLPGAQAEAEFWRRLNSGEFGGTAKGLQWLAPLIKMLK